MAQLDLIADAELSRLKLQNREIKAYIQNLQCERRSQIVAHSKIYKLLQQEHAKIHIEYQILQEILDSAHKNKVIKHFQTVLDQYEELKSVYTEEKVNLWELESHVKKVAIQIKSLEKNRVTDNSYKATINKVQKDVVTLENRLDVICKKCCAALAENSILRQSIDNMLQYRSQFNDLWQDLVALFDNGKKRIIEIIDQSIVAFDQREEICHKVQIVKDKMESEKLVYIQEMRELQRNLEHTTKLQNFYDVKGHKRTQAGLNEKEMSKLLKQRELLETETELFKGIITKIKELSGESNTKALSYQYNRQEEENFAIFNYVNELNAEVETLTDIVNKYISEIEHESDRKRATSSKGDTTSIKSLTIEKELQEKHHRISQNEKKICNGKYDEIVQGVEKIFKLSHFEVVPILNVLNWKGYSLSQNIDLVMGIISKRVDTIMNNTSSNDAQLAVKKQCNAPKFNVKEATTKKK